MMRAWLVGIPLAFILAIGLVACGDDDDQAATPTPADGTPTNGTPPTNGEGPTGTVLRVGVPAMPVGLDFDLSHGNRMTWEAMANCHYQPLTFNIIDYDESQYGPVPEGLDEEVLGFRYLDYASGPQPNWFESWELSEDGSSATITIRPGILSPAGNELTSEDVAWKIERSRHLQVIGYFFSDVIMRLDPDNAVEIVDDHTFILHAIEPNELIQSIWTNSYHSVFDSTEAQNHATADDPYASDWIATNGACFGSYHVESWSPGREVVFARNPNYQPAPYFERVVYRVIPEASSRFAALTVGEIDIATDLSPEQLDQAQGTAGIKVLAGKCNCNFFGFMNINFEPWDSQEVRQAVNHVIPRQAIADAVFGGFATPWECAYHCIYPGADPDLWPYGTEPDFEAARDLIAASGYSTPIDVELSFSTAFPEFAQAAELMRANLGEIGINVRLNPMADGDYTAQTVAKETPFGLWHDTYIQPDPIYQLALSFYDPQTINNYAALDDEEFKAMIDECSTELTLDGRVECTRPAQEKALEMAGYAWIVEPFLTLAVREDLDGFVVYNTKFFLFKDVFER